MRKRKKLGIAFVGVVLLLSTVLWSCKNNENVKTGDTTYLGMSINQNVKIDGFNDTTLEQEEGYDYAINKTEKVTVVVSFSNPQQFDILSFKINGFKYQSYMFLQGSDSENIYVEVPAGFETGVLKYTIEEIKYIDGKTIDDAKMDGKDSIRIYILPTNISLYLGFERAFNSIAINYNVTDVDLILNSNFDVKVVNSNDVNEVYTAAIPKGDSNGYLLFDNLKTNNYFTITVKYKTFDGYHGELEYTETHVVNTLRVNFSYTFKIDGGLTYLRINTNLNCIVNKEIYVEVTELGSTTKNYIINANNVSHTYYIFSLLDLNEGLSYKINIEFSYDLGDGTGVKDVVIDEYNHSGFFEVSNGALSFNYSKWNGKNIDTMVTPEYINGVKVTSIAEDAFRHKTNVKVQVKVNHLIISEGVTLIDRSGCSSLGLTSVTLPSSLRTIGIAGFIGNNMKTLNIPNGVTTIGVSAFVTGELETVTIPASVTTIGDSAFAANKIYSLVLSNGVVDIGSQAFVNNRLTSITLPSSVRTIGMNAFAWNYLTTVKIPKTVTSIAAGAFQNNRLTSITVPSALFPSELTIEIVFGKVETVIYED